MTNKHINTQAIIGAIILALFVFFAFCSCNTPQEYEDSKEHKERISQPQRRVKIISDGTISVERWSAYYLKGDTVNTIVTKKNSQGIYVQSSEKAVLLN